MTTRRKTMLRGAGSALGVAAILSLGALSEAPSFAQEADGLEEVIITGSRVQRSDLEATAPVLALDTSALSQLGFENFADVATQLPQFAPSFGTSRTQSTFSGAASSGLNTVNLRNLGPQRTVVLINGRRVTSGSPTSTFVDWNTLPTANVERIDVLSGGASAVYGADAVAGVINIITKKRFEGVEIGVSYGEAKAGDNDNPNGYLILGGRLGDRGSGTLTVQADYQGQVSCKDRFLCAEDFFWSPPSAPIRGPAAYSGVGLSPQIFIGSGRFISRNGQWTDSSGNLIPFNVTIDGYNRNADRDIAIPTRRVMIAAEGEYGISDNVTAFAEINYGSAKINSQFEGHPFQSNSAGSLFGGGPGVPGLQPSIPIDNPFIPAAIRTAATAAGLTSLTWWQRFNPYSARGAVNERDSVRVLAGVKGTFEAPFGKDWRWEAYHIYGRMKLDSLTEGLVGTDRLYYGLRVEPDPARPGEFRCVDPGARAAGCIPLNVFAPPTPEMVRYLSVTAGQSGRSQLENTVATVDGSLLELPAGDVRVSLGVERRAFKGFLDYDETINRGLATGNQIGDISLATVNVNEVFLATRVPLLKELPFANELSVEGSYRWSNPQRGDDYDTWGLGLNWEPVSGLKFRASRNTSVRAPVPGELSGIGLTAGVVNDPCTAARRNANPTRAANCAADGVPATYTPPITVEQSVSGFVGGNPNLDNEESKSLTFGVVWQPSFIENFAIAVDRFDAELDGAINTVGRQTKANLCYDTTNRQFCEDLTRSSDPAVLGGTVNYVLKQVNDQLRNIASYKITGFDIDLTYAFGLGSLLRSESDLGTLTFKGLMTIYDKAEYTPVPGGATIELLDNAGGSTSDQGYIKRTANYTLRYNYQSITATWNTRWIGSAKMSPFAPAAAPRVGSHAYHNLRLGWEFKEGSELYVGGTNLFDKQPPFFCSGCAGTQALDTIPGYYDIFGRSWYAGAKVRF